MEVNKYDIQRLGKRASDEDLDYLWIRQRTRGWGFNEVDRVYQTWEETVRGESFRMSIGDDDQTYVNCNLLSSVDAGRFKSNRVDNEGELRYIAKINRGIKWECVNEYQANRWAGIVLMPEKHDPDGKIYCAQFPLGWRNIKRIWMTIEQANKALELMINGASLTEAIR